MSVKDQIYLEEVLIAYLKSNKKVKLLDIKKEVNEESTDLTVKFRSESDFARTLVQGLNNKFSEFFESHTIN